MDCVSDIIYIKQEERTGLRSEPWCTPDMMFAGDEWEPFIEACWVRLARKDFIQYSVDPVMPL